MSPYLNGRPQNNLNELWALLNFCLPNIFDSSESFAEWFNSPFEFGEKVEIGEEMELVIINRLHQVLRPFLLRREKSEVLGQLPEKVCVVSDSSLRVVETLSHLYACQVEIILRCELSGMQMKLYDQLQRRGRLVTRSGEGAGVRALNNQMIQLRKVCNHPLLHIEEHLEEMCVEDLIRSSGKFELLDRICYKYYRTTPRHRVCFLSFAFHGFICPIP